MKQYIDLIKRIARRYTLPPKCAITHDDLIQEGCLALLEASAFRQPSMDDREVYSTARKAMQRAMTAYISPVTRSLDETLYTDDNGNSITLADTIPDDALTPLQLMTHSENLHALRMGLRALNPRQQLILHRLFAEGKTAVEVAHELGTSEVRIRVIKHELIRKLKKM